MPNTPICKDIVASADRPSRQAARRRVVLHAVSALAATSGALLGKAATAQTQDFPNRTIRMIVPLGVGGLGDVIARQVAEASGRQLGQSIIVDNRPGAGGTLGSAIAANANPDGYTVLLGSIGTIGIAPFLYASLPYDADKAFTPITLAAGGQFFFAVTPSLPAHSLREFIDYAKAHPGKLNYGSQGNGSTLHLAMEQLRETTGIQMVHVPFKSAPELAAALVSGEISVAITDFASILPLVRSQRVRALAVTGDKRSEALPDLPTLAEAGLPGMRFISWVGFLAPAGTPAPIVGRLHAAMVAALATPSVRQAIQAAGGSEIFGTSPEEFGRFLASERAQWSKVIRTLGLKAN